MLLKRTSHVIILLFFLGGTLFAISPTSAMSSGPKLVLGLNTIYVNQNSDNPRRQVFAGSSVHINVATTADMPTQPRRADWPEDYILEAALDLPEGESFVPTAGLIEQLTPTPFMTHTNIAAEQVLEEGSLQYYNPYEHNRKSWFLHIPANLAGHTVTLRAQYHHGEMILSDVSPTMTLLAPLNDSDSARVLGSMIDEARQKTQPDRVFALTDSLLSLGWSDPFALNGARSVAVSLQKYDKALTYLNKLYEDYGITGISSKKIPPLNRTGARDPQIQQLYERMRTELIQLRSEQEQQR